MLKMLSSLKLMKEGIFSSRIITKNFPHKHLSTAKWNYVLPGQVSERRQVPSYIPLPPYALTGKVPDLRFTDPPLLTPEIKDQSQIAAMKRSCRLARFVLDSVDSIIKVGITTDEIDQFVHDLITDNAAYPSPLNYRGFPKSVCTSVNNVACHGIPDDRPLADGDIINVDVTVYLAGFHGDCSKTFLVGNVDEAGKRLVKVAEEAMMEGIKVCRPGEHFFKIGVLTSAWLADSKYAVSKTDAKLIARLMNKPTVTYVNFYVFNKDEKKVDKIIGKVVDDYACEHGYTSIGAFAGHGIGTYFHGPPDIFHIYNGNTGIMDVGMTFTVEPVLSEGKSNIIVLEDGWTAVTEDNSRTAQFENTILITEDGYNILTK